MDDGIHVSQQVRARSTVHGSGEVQVARTVMCPDRGPLSVVECQFCPNCDSLMVDQEQHITNVVCHPKAAPEGERAGRTRLPSLADRTPISAVMSRDVLCVSSDVSIEALMVIFLERRIGALPVVDDDGRPVGVVTKTDLVRHRYEDEEPSDEDPELRELAREGYRVRELARATAREVMVPDAFTLREDEALSRAAALMSIQKIHHLPVVASDGRVVGMLSSQDLVRWIAEGSGYHR